VSCNESVRNECEVIYDSYLTSVLFNVGRLLIVFINERHDSEYAWRAVCFKIN